MAEVQTGMTVDVPDDWEEFQKFAEERDWSDGLPLVPPTPERVDAMLRQVQLEGDENLGPMPPKMGHCQVAVLAANAVMAGCRPEYFPVVLAAVEAVLVPDFNLYGIQPTTNPVTPFLLVNGPIADELGMNSGSGALGPGVRSNATIGRAMRLIQLNVGGAIPGRLDRATQGSPAKYTFAAAENQADSPWPGFAEHRGFAASDSAVTAFGVCGVHNIIDLTSTRSDEILTTLAAGMSAKGTNNVHNGGDPVLLLPPEHADILEEEGFTRKSVAEYLFENARLDITGLPDSYIELTLSRRPDWADPKNLPIADVPEDIHIAVVGGPGIHSVFLPTFGSTKPSTVRVRANPLQEESTTA